jgi:hypothetical protein
MAITTLSSVERKSQTKSVLVPHAAQVPPSVTLIILVRTRRTHQAMPAVRSCHCPLRTVWGMPVGAATSQSCCFAHTRLYSSVLSWWTGVQLNHHLCPNRTTRS